MFLANKTFENPVVAKCKSFHACRFRRFVNAEHCLFVKCEFLCGVVISGGKCLDCKGRIKATNGGKIMRRRKQNFIEYLESMEKMEEEQKRKHKRVKI